MSGIIIGYVLAFIIFIVITILGVMWYNDVKSKSDGSIQTQIGPISESNPGPDPSFDHTLSSGNGPDSVSKWSDWMVETQLLTMTHTNTKFTKKLKIKEFGPNKFAIIDENNNYLTLMGTTLVPETNLPTLYWNVIQKQSGSIFEWNNDTTPKYLSSNGSTTTISENLEESRWI
jgi:hypothetical protein